MKFYLRIFIVGFINCWAFAAYSQQLQKNILKNTSLQYHKKEQYNNSILTKKIKQTIWNRYMQGGNANEVASLTGIDIFGFPVYTTTHSNLTSAVATHTHLLWQNPYNVTGLSNVIKGKIAVWDEGVASNNHIELNGRINQKNTNVAQHATHVTGTMIAAGINPLSKGMAYNTPQIDAYNYNNHISKISGAANDLLISNHSYGVVAGWYLNFGEWQFYGSPGDTADYKFGYYDAETQMLDSIAYNAPNYLIVKSVGNNRNKNGPAIGQPYKRFDATGAMVDAGNRQSGLSSNDGFDIIPTYGVAKNILTIGAIDASVGSNKIEATNFSSWGPTDDGRIKPDIVGAGVDVYSCISDNNFAYDTYSGTSMATPNVAASLYLLQELYAKNNNDSLMKASTVKALAIHTATAGGNNSAPNYKTGWGLFNAEKAAKIIAEKNTGTHKIIEHRLNNSDTFSIDVIASGAGNLLATLCWTDPAGLVNTSNVLNNPALKLMHDLDIRIYKFDSVYYPWILDPIDPNAAATRGDNIRDNVEKIEIDNTIVGQRYTIKVFHKGFLQRGYQNFSLVLSGIGGSLCTAFTINNGYVLVDSFNIANVKQTTAGCSAYNDYRTLTPIQFEPSKTYPLQLNLSNCNATTNPKIAKVYVDYNSNGSFADAGELLCTSPVIGGIGSYNTTITTPANIVIGNKTILRLVVVETNNANGFDACSPIKIYGNVQDYTVQFIKPTIDIAVNNISMPESNACANNNQFVTISICNSGSADIVNIPLRAVIKNGATTVATLTGIYSDTLFSGTTANYTFQNGFTTLASANYFITATNDLAADQNLNNNTATANVLVTANGTASTGQANICGNNAMLQTFGGNNLQSLFWFDTAANKKPIATGQAATSNVLSNKYFIASGINSSVGLVDKTISADGDYQVYGGNYFMYNAKVPLLLQSAKMYTAHAGKVHIIVADIKRTYPNGSYDYNTISEMVVDVIASRPTKALGNVTGNDAADTGFYYNINLLLPTGNHALIIKTDSIANIFRNKNISATIYPMNIGNAFSIISNNATAPNEFYYYLYSMRLRTLDCESNLTEVIPTVAPKPTINLTNDSLVCTASINYQWQKNGVDIVDAIEGGYKPDTTATYTCMATDVTGCTQVSNSLFYDKTQRASNTIYANPNPAKDFIDIIYKTDSNQIDLRIVGVDGRTYLLKHYKNVAGVLIDKLYLKNFATGLYLLQVFDNGNKYSKKIIVTR